MAVQQAPLFALHAPGYPSALVVGRAVNLRFFISGAPVPKGRHRARVVAPKGKKPFVQFYSDKNTEAWETLVAESVLEQVRALPQTPGEEVLLPLEGRTLMTVRFNFHKPVSYSASVKHHVKRPDVDNLAKAILDALQNARIITEDNQVTDLLTYKRYQDAQHPEGVEVDLLVVRD